MSPDNCQGFLRILEKQGRAAAGRVFLGLQGLPLLAGIDFYYFFLFVCVFFHVGLPAAKGWEGFLDRSSGGHRLKTRAQARHGCHCSPTQALSAGSSMELWAASLLLCLFSLLTQVTAESPTLRPPNPKVKKAAANVKKGKEGTVNFLDLNPCLRSSLLPSPTQSHHTVKKPNLWPGSMGLVL